MATRKKVVSTTIWPKVDKGNHLTVYTYEDGSTKLEWDDDALLSEIRNAMLKYESTPVAKNIKPAVKAKVNKKISTKTVANKTVAKKATNKKSKA